MASVPGMGQRALTGEGADGGHLFGGGVAGELTPVGGRGAGRRRAAHQQKPGRRGHPVARVRGRL
ncbi:hypothetical protein ACFXB4_31145 [Streptomyces lavendulae]|uniref:hypothetical protein n=1 Tax=Streptomyces lavendulae TaxID=1914 RepID=UPI0036802F6C